MYFMGALRNFSLGREGKGKSKVLGEYSGNHGTKDLNTWIWYRCNSGPRDAIEFSPFTDPYPRSGVISDFHNLIFN